MLRTGKEHLESLRDGRVVYVGGERVDDVTTPSGVPRRRRRPSPAIYDLKADPANRDTHDLRGGRRPPLDLFPAAQDPRRPAAAHGRPPHDRRLHLRHVRPLARSRRLVRHRHGDEARRAAQAARLRRQPGRTITATSATTTSTWSTRWCRRRPRAIRNSITSRTSRCRRCAWCARTTTASSSPA